MEMPNETFTVESWQGPRTWRRTGGRDYVTRDGRNVVLGVWQSMCAVCGKPFEVVLPPGVRSAGQSKCFQLMTCAEHRLTASEGSRIRFAHADRRAAVFEAIKHKKLGDRDREPAG